MRMDFGIFVGFGDTPCCRAVADKCIGEENYRSHVLDGDAGSLKRHVEAVCRRCRSHHSEGRFAIASVESLHQVGLFGFGRKTG